jgi:hypothetical protein
MNTYLPIQIKFYHECIPANTNRIPHTNVRCFLLVLHCPTKHIMIPIVNINKLANGNHVDRRIVTEIESHSLLTTKIKIWQ